MCGGNSFHGREGGREGGREKGEREGGREGGRRREGGKGVEERRGEIGGEVVEWSGVEWSGVEGRGGKGLRDRAKTILL